MKPRLHFSLLFQSEPNDVTLLNRQTHTLCSVNAGEVPTVAMCQYTQQYSNLQIHNDSASLRVDRQICKAGAMSNKG